MKNINTIKEKIIKIIRDNPYNGSNSMCMQYFEIFRDGGLVEMYDEKDINQAIKELINDKVIKEITSEKKQENVNRGGVGTIYKSSYILLK